MIDIKTGLLIWSLEAASLSAMLLGLWIFVRRSPTLLFWCIGSGLHGLGLAGVAMRGYLPDFISIQVANTSATFGIGLLLAGVLSLDSRPVSFTIFIPAFIWTGGMLFPEIRETLYARIALYHTAAVIGHGLTGMALLQRGGLLSKTRSGLAAMFFLQATLSVTMIVIVLLYKPPTFADIPYAPPLAGVAALCVVGMLVFGTRLTMIDNEDRLKRLAATDPLTGLLNRRGFENAFDALNATSIPGRPLVALAHLDLDHFKRINDAYGHHAGDSVLVTFARIMDAIMAGRGVVGRLGGEEFACALRVSSAADAVEVTSRIREALRHTPIPVSGTDIIVSACAGIALAPNGTTLFSLLDGSDRALYAAKRAGRDRIGLDCEDGVAIVSLEDEAAIGDSTDRQVAALHHMGLIGRGG